MPDYKLTDVDTKAIENAANSIDKDVKELQSISTILSGNIMGSVTPYWQGPAKNSFEKQFTVFQETFKKYVNNYNELNEKLKTISSTYEYADNSVKQQILRIPK